MRVVEVTQFGGPEVLAVREVPDPTPGHGEAVVDVAAADILFLDTQLREGWGEGFFPLNPPYVPGNGVAGRVIAVGDDVDEQWLGGQVVARTGRVPETGPPAPNGGYAERVAVPASHLVEVPAGVDVLDALALLHDGPTALYITDRVKIKPGEWVLITAAAGSLGVVLTQLVRAAGGRIIAAARGERKLELARRTGAEVAVDYSADGWEERVRAATGNAGVDVVFDGAGGVSGGAAFRATAPGARFYAYGAASGDFATVTPEEAKAREVTLLGILDGEPDTEPAERRVEKVLSDAAAGRLKPHVGQTFPLEAASEAHAAIAARTALGKTLPERLRLGPPSSPVSVTAR